MKSNWNYPTTVWVGEDRIKDLVKACVDLKIKKPLFVTDKDLVNLLFIENIISDIKKNFKNYKFIQIFRVILLVRMLKMVLRNLKKIIVMV